MTHYHVKKDPKSLKLLGSFIYHYLHILASHKTNSQFSLSLLSIYCLKLGHHISRHNYSQNLTETNLLSVALPHLCMNSKLSAGREEIEKSESVERKRHGSCSRPNRSMGDKHVSKKAMMNS